MVTDIKKGVRLDGVLVTLNAALVANRFNLFEISNFATQIGVKTYRIKKMHACNYSGGDTWLYVGTGLQPAAFVQRLVRIRLVNNFDGDVDPSLFSDAEFGADITAFVDNATCEVQIDVDEIG